jgi:inorganic pyrophosphatase
VYKPTGILKIDRPQMFSNVCPAVYGFVPQTYCAEKVGELCQMRTGRPNIMGDGDPLDICILTEKDISHGDLLLQAVPLGGFRMIDKDQADDKIISVLKGDAAYGHWKEIEDCAPALIQRLKHYFLTYKKAPDSTENTCEITDLYNREEAYEVIRRSQVDYDKHFYTS